MAVAQESGFQGPRTAPEPSPGVLSYLDTLSLNMGESFDVRGWKPPPESRPERINHDVQIVYAPRPNGTWCVEKPGIQARRALCPSGQDGLNFNLPLCPSGQDGLNFTSLCARRGKTI